MLTFLPDRHKLRQLLASYMLASTLFSSHLILGQLNLKIREFDAAGDFLIPSHRIALGLLFRFDQ